MSTIKLQTGRFIETKKIKTFTAAQRARLEELEARTILEVDPSKPYGMGRRVAMAETAEDAQRLVACANSVISTELERQNGQLLKALKSAQRTINSMKVEAETGAQGDERMMLEAAEQISKEGLAADMAIRETIEKITGQKG